MVLEFRPDTASGAAAPWMGTQQSSQFKATTARKAVPPRESAPTFRRNFAARFTAENLARMPEKLYRACEILNRDGADNRIEVSFSSEAPYDRGSYVEILSHRAADCDLSKLPNGPVLDGHDTAKQVGVVESAAIAGTKGVATLRFSKSARGQELLGDIKDGIRRNFSVGYETLKAVGEEMLADGRKAIRFAWRAYEISPVAIPADMSVGYQRTQSHTETKKIMETQTATSNTPEQKRVAEIEAVAKIIGRSMPHQAQQFQELAAHAILAGTDESSFKRSIRDAMRPAEDHCEAVHNVGMDRRDVQRYSFTRALANCIANRGVLKGCYEADLHQQVERNSQSRAEGFFVPMEVMMTRDLTAGIPTAGGNFVATDMLPMIELLRNKMAVVRLGATMLSGLAGNISIPRQISSATAQSVAETEALSDSTPAIDQVLMSPKRVGATTTYSKQLLLQSSTSVEQFVRSDLMAVVALRIDLLALTGTGLLNQPLGLINQPLVGAVTFGGAATLAKIISFETALATAGADSGNTLAYLTSASVRAKLKQTPTLGTTFPEFLWERGDFADGSNDGLLNDYRAASSEQIPGGKVIFGRWADLILGMWNSGFDVVTDPYTLAKKAEVVVTINSWIDCAVRHPGSFAVSTDSGAI